MYAIASFTITPSSQSHSIGIRMGPWSRETLARQPPSVMNVPPQRHLSPMFGNLQNLGLYVINFELFDVVPFMHEIDGMA